MPNEDQSQTVEYQEDLNLSQSVRKKNSKACRLFYNKYAPALLRRLHRMVGNERDAEDGLQQTFTEAFRSLGNYRGRGPLGAWLNRICTNVAMDILRRRSRWRSFIEKAQLAREDLHHEVLPLPDTLFLKEETKRVVWELTQQLTPRKRLAVIMCDLEGQTLEHAAEELGVPLGTLISRLYHGRRDLRRLLEHESQNQGVPLGEWIDG